MKNVLYILAISSIAFGSSSLAIAGAPAPTDYLVGTWQGTYSVKGSACPANFQGDKAVLYIGSVQKLTGGYDPDYDANFSGTLTLNNFSAVAKVNNMRDYSTAQDVKGSAISAAIGFGPNGNAGEFSDQTAYNYFDSEDPSNWTITVDNWGTCQVHINPMKKSA